MAIYYVDAASVWASSQAGTSTGTAYGGRGAGLQKALDTVAAGDSIYLKGGVYASAPSILNANFFTITSANNNAATWLVGDAIQNNTGAGNHWTGVIYKISTTLITVSCSTGNYNACATAEGVSNTTRAATDTLTAKATLCFVAVTAGTIAAGLIKIIGCDSSWNPYAGYVQILSDSNTVLPTPYAPFVPAEYNYISNIISGGLGGRYGLYSGSAGVTFSKCVAATSAQHSIYLNAFSCNLLTCIVQPSNSASYVGIYSASRYANIINCEVQSQPGTGIMVEDSYQRILNNLIYNSGKQGINVDGGFNTLIEGNIIDKTAATYAGIYIATGMTYTLMRRNRITNCSTFGIQAQTAMHDEIEDYNYFQSNTSGNLSNVDAGPNSVSGADANCGYADSSYAASRDYRLSSTATGVGQALKYDPSQTGLVNTFYPTMGIPPIYGGGSVIVVDE